MDALRFALVVLGVTLVLQPWVRRRLTRDYQRCKPGLVVMGFDVFTSRRVPGDQMIIFPNPLRLYDDTITCVIHVDTTAFDQEMARVRQHLRITHEMLARVQDPRAFIINGL